MTRNTIAPHMAQGDVTQGPAGTGASRGLDALLAPDSIAVVGASGDPHRIGGRPLQYLVRFGYSGRIYPVNPKHAELHGHRCYPDLASLPEAVDCAVICLGADHVVGALEACAQRGIRSAVVFAAGFAEHGPEGRARQQRITAIARESGMRILGPNTVGLRDLERAVFGTFSTDVDSGCRSGPLAVVTQSGGLGVYFGAALPRLAGLGTRFMIDTGNEADVEVSECLDYVSHAPDVAAVGVVLEGCRDGRAFVDACARARSRGTAVVALKIGRSERGAAAVRSHTGALAGEDAVWDAALAAGGAIRAHDEVEFFDVLSLYGNGRPPAGNRVGLVSLSGGVATLMVDACADVGLDVPDIPPPPADLLAGIPSGASANPLDVSANLANNPGITGPVLRHVVDQDTVDALVVWMAYVPQSPILGPALADQFVDVAGTTSKPVCLSGLASPDIQERLVAAGISVSTYPTRLLRALALAARAPHPAAHAELRPAPSSGGRAEVLIGARAEGLLPDVPFAPCRTVDSGTAAVEAATALGFPVVLKGEADGLLHKTELGLVHVGLGSADEVLAAFADVARALSDAAGDDVAGGTRVVVQPQVSGVECFAGVKVDPIFGPTVTVGMGGVLVEVEKDVTTLLAPTDVDDVLTAVLRLRGYARLEGVRGDPPRDVRALAAVVAALSRVPLAHPDIVEIDLNPIMVDVDTAVAVDAVVVREVAP